jgi:hypothetical protein
LLQEASLLVDNQYTQSKNNVSIFNEDLWPMHVRQLKEMVVNSECLLQEDFWQVNKPMHAKQKECLFFQWRLMTNAWKELKGMVLRWMI